MQVTKETASCNWKVKAISKLFGLTECAYCNFLLVNFEGKQRNSISCSINQISSSRTGQQCRTCPVARLKESKPVLLSLRGAGRHHTIHNWLEICRSNDCSISAASLSHKAGRCAKLFRFFLHREKSCLRRSSPLGSWSWRGPNCPDKPWPGLPFSLSLLSWALSTRIILFQSLQC